MKLQATYWKNADGSIKATIEVLDAGDFPRSNIFPSASITQENEEWNLGEGTESTISQTLPTSDEAKQWVSAQISALKAKLDHWRGIMVPEPEEFEV
ncbi:MAG TPA: hypothetical protein EYP21_00810 [Syntrophaceae bacterium]|nr:hypothetical protein [Syntrophaceae bacterium]